VANDRLTPENHFQDTRLIKIAQTENRAIYEPGDVVVIKPCNLPDSVDIFCSVCPNLDYSTPFVVRDPENGRLIFSGHENKPSNFRFQIALLYIATNLLYLFFTLRTYLETYLDLQAIPKRSFFEILAWFAKDDREKEKLLEFSDSKHSSDLIAYTTRPRRTVAETCRDFPLTSQLVPLERWFDLLAPIGAREFSIASSPRAHPGELHILLAVVNFRNVLMRSPRLGT